MRRSLLDVLACPSCGAGLALALEGHRGDEEFGEGELRCERCRGAYPIVRGIPRFVPSSNYADSFGLQWNRFPRTQLDSHTRTSITRDRFLAQWGCPPESFEGLRVLDVGCGSGRFAEVALSLGAEVVAVDYSAAVDACRANLANRGRFEILQGDVHCLPFRPEQFDRVYCFGVLMATPDPSRAFRGLVPQVRPGGMLCVDQYDRTWKALLHPKYALRPLTSRVSPQRLFPVVERLAPPLLALSRALGRIPAVGWGMSRLVPVANYEGILPLDDRQLREWAVLDTFDWLSPRYDNPQNAADLRRSFEEAGLSHVEVSTPQKCHVTARGTKPPTNASNSCDARFDAGGKAAASSIAH